MLYLFLVDTSASMNQRTVNGLSLLDAAKACIERFVTLRSQNPNSRNDHYFLVTTSEGLIAERITWKDGYNEFLTAVKTLSARDFSDLPAALRKSWDLLNMHRLESGIDSYGLGRKPWPLEPGVVILLTDGGPITSPSGLRGDLTLPATNLLPGATLTTDHFRWDQRLFVIRLHLAGIYNPRLRDPAYQRDVENESITGFGGPRPHLNLLCEATGGSLYTATEMKYLLGMIENIASRCQKPGVVVKLRLENAPESAMRRTFIALSQQSPATWPFPEDVVITPQLTSLPPRQTHPVLFFSPNPTPISAFQLDNFFMDQYTLEPGYVTEYVTSALISNSNSVLPVSVALQRPNQMDFDVLAPVEVAKDIVGYLAIVPGGVVLKIGAYNHLQCVQLLREFANFFRNKTAPTAEWRMRWDAYLHGIPFYYISYLRHAIGRWGGTQFHTQLLIPDSLDSIGLNYGLQQYFHELIYESRLDADRRDSTRSLESKPTQPRAQSTSIVSAIGPASTSSSSKFHSSSSQNLQTNPVTSHVASAIQGDTAESTDGGLPPLTNVFDIPRSQLITEIRRLRSSLLGSESSHPYPLPQFSKPSSRPLNEPDTSPRFNQPIAQMGNYVDFLSKLQKLRPVVEDEAATERLHAFGSPFRLKKKMIGDYGDVDEVTAEPRLELHRENASPRSRGRKRINETPEDDNPSLTKKARAGEPEALVSQSTTVKKLEEKEEPSRPSIIRSDATLKSNDIPSTFISSIQSIKPPPPRTKFEPAIQPHLDPATASKLRKRLLALVRTAGPPLWRRDTGKPEELYSDILTLARSFQTETQEGHSFLSTLITYARAFKKYQLATALERIQN